MGEFQRVLLMNIFHVIFNKIEFVCGSLMPI